MLQETTAAAAAQTGGSNAAALSQMGFGNLLQEMISTPGHYAVSWAVLITLTLMSVLSIYWIVTNFIKNMRLKGTSDRVISTFWETPNAQDAPRKKKWRFNPAKENGNPVPSTVRVPVVFNL